MNPKEFEETLRSELGESIFNQIFEGCEFVKVEKRPAEPGIAEGVYISTRDSRNKYLVRKMLPHGRISIRDKEYTFSDGSSYVGGHVETEEGTIDRDYLPVSEEFLRLVS